MSSAATAHLGARWAGMSLVVAAVAQIGASPSWRRRAAVAGMGRRSTVLVAVAERYARSAPGRRRARRLEAAAIETSAFTHLRAQLAAQGVGIVVVSLLVGPSVLGTSLSLLVVRSGVRLHLALRRGRRAELLRAALPLLARSLAVELGAGASPREALASAGEEASLPACAQRLLVQVSRRAAAGLSLGAALAAAGAVEPSEARAEIGVLAALVDSAVGGGAGTGCLLRHADTLETDARLVADARAEVAEVRLAALAVPALSAVLAVALLTGSPSAARAAQTAPVALLLGGCVGVVLLGVAGMRRLTRF